MVNPKVVFLTGLNQAIIDEVVSYVPGGFDLTVFGKLSPTTLTPDTPNEDVDVDRL